MGVASRAKAIAGDRVEVTADIFRDGTAELAAVVRYERPHGRGCGILDGTLRQRSLVGELPTAAHGSLALHDRSVDRPFRNLAPRTRRRKQRPGRPPSSTWKKAPC